MEPKRNISDYDLDAPDLEIFSSTTPAKVPKKPTGWQDLLNKTYIRTSLTLFLLLFLFGSTFFIASKIDKPSFTTPSADIGYIPQAQIDIPVSTGIRGCSEINYEIEDATFLQSFCRGDFCTDQSNGDVCESIDVVVLENGILSEVSGQDGISDCIWIEEESVCKPGY
jgi:hypothetical protein